MAINVFLKEYNKADLTLNLTSPLRDIYNYLFTPVFTQFTYPKREFHEEENAFENIYRPNAIKPLGEVFSIQLASQLEQDPLGAEREIGPKAMLKNDEFEILTRESFERPSLESLEPDLDDIRLHFKTPLSKVAARYSTFHTTENLT